MERDYDYDWLVIGSGFGGSVSALRLSEKGHSVGVLECGRRFADHELPRSTADLKRYFWNPMLGMKGIFRLTIFKDVSVVSGCGVGGGSLGYANTLYVPPKAFFEDPQWAEMHDWESPRVDYVVIGIRQHHEALFDQDPGGFQQSGIIREERLLVADHFQLHPVGQADFAPQHGRTHRIVGGVARRRIRQDENLRSVDVIDQRFLGAVRQVDAAHRHGHHIGAAGLVAAHHLFKTTIFSRSHDEPRRKLPSRYS